MEVEILENDYEDTDEIASEAENTEPETSQELSDDHAAESSTSSVDKKRPLRLPFARVKNMMKTDPQCGLLSQDAVFLIAKATELFLEVLAKESVRQMQLTKRKTILKRDVDTAIEHMANFCFLDGALE